MIWLQAYILSIVAANATLAWAGVVPVGFGLVAPAGVVFAGLSFTLRDLAQDETGRRGVLAAILLGAALSWWIAPAFAVASAAAFLVSELCDFAVYTPLRERRWLLAVALSNVVGMAVDSCLFLLLAFGSLEFLPGLVLAKLYTIPPAVTLLWLWRRRAGVYVPRATHPSAG